MYKLMDPLRYIYWNWKYWHISNKHLWRRNRWQWNTGNYIHIYWKYIYKDTQKSYFLPCRTPRQPLFCIVFHFQMGHRTMEVYGKIYGGPFWLVILTNWGRDKMAAIFQTTFSNAFYWIKMFKFRLRFHWSLFPRVQLTMFHHWFR